MNKFHIGNDGFRLSLTESESSSGSINDSSCEIFLPIPDTSVRRYLGVW